MLKLIIKQANWGILGSVFAFAIGFFVKTYVIREVGATAITITHDMESARKIANNISMLYKGKVIWTGKASEIDNSDNKYLDQFIKGKSVGPIKININD